MTILWMTSERSCSRLLNLWIQLAIFANDISGWAVKKLSRRTFETASNRLAQEAKVIRKK